MDPDSKYAWHTTLQILFSVFAAALIILMLGWGITSCHHKGNDRCNERLIEAQEAGYYLECGSNSPYSTRGHTSHNHSHPHKHKHKSGKHSK